MGRAARRRGQGCLRAGAAALLALAAGCAQPPPPPAPPPYQPSVGLEVLDAKPAEPRWRLLRTETLKRANKGVEFPSELELEVIATEPDRGALVVRPYSWRGKRVTNYLADRNGDGVYKKTVKPEEALTFRIYLAFNAPGPARIPYVLPDGFVPADHENLRPRFAATPFINKKIADLGVTVDSCDDIFYYQYTVTEGPHHQFGHIEGSGWILDPQPPGPFGAAKHALLLLAEGFQMERARAALTQPAPAPADPTPTVPGQIAPLPAAPSWYCPRPPAPTS
jgi:hypothetical protein